MATPTTSNIHYPVHTKVRDTAHINTETHTTLYQQSLETPEAFWAKQAERIDWVVKPSTIKNCSFDKDKLAIRWFEDGRLNASVNCLDRHLEQHGNQLAMIWEPDSETATVRKYTYQQLHTEVCKLANGLKSLGVAKGEVVTLYMPMIPEATIAMLACARIGAVHSVVFGGFSPEALAGRIEDGQSKLVITADAGNRGGRRVALKDNVDEAISLCTPDLVQNVLVVNHCEAKTSWQTQRDVDYKTLIEKQNDNCAPEVMAAEDPLFILYTSGSTGKPKGAVHSTGGYMVYTSLSHHCVFDYKPGEIYWCMADIGWITGHSYAVYGPLSNAATMVMYEGIPNYPDAGRLARIIDKHQVNILYTAPTVIRALMACRDEALANTDRRSLRLLGTAGEPINPEAWTWFYEQFGHSQCPILDTWWQTETGGIMIAPLPGAIGLKPGSATVPFFGIHAALVDNNGKLLHGEAEGNLVICDSWPGQMRTIFGDHQRFIDTYFSTFEGYYFSSDGARRDEDGYYWITGRVDDVLNVSGHRLGTAELESALAAHPLVAEAAVVGFPHPIKGEGIYAYITLTDKTAEGETLRNELKQWLRKEIGPIAATDVIQWTDDLPKTRSGKIMRRILRKIAADDYENLGDLSTLADPAVVTKLIETHSEEITRIA
ncbi:Acetyl-coenzyme A synthetase [Zhongshania aliphaticivorans]|uniref:Acetyl-coenzyme A synthetase n=1 Tax=Zhongshania aliphaticivorans TaxID=1470434 RepID=A0A5S9PXY3_9GAMM|nr:acetate--CoA ligase [Zhongshania aliphaticivorans]CAA0109260.1 Acetyl-coenzyme A synthetase [Zhongshania aliphaticivorans]CAA0117508.1 Acetyl-coenzyme A synthetase [Zhongshania aliphaticivorans]